MQHFDFKNSSFQRARRHNLALGGGLLAALGFGLGNAAQAQGVGTPLKLFPATLLDGKLFDPATFQGSVILVYAWATWCPHCKRDLPVLQEKYLSLKDKGFNILGLNIDKDAELAAKWTVANKIDFPSLKLNAEYKATYMPDRVRTPSWWLAGRDGLVVDSVSGSAEFVYRQRKDLLDKLVSG
jgi:thiol-disulfide isomerase/thioredoxin